MDRWAFFGSIAAGAMALTTALTERRNRPGYPEGVWAPCEFASAEAFAIESPDPNLELFEVSMVPASDGVGTMSVLIQVDTSELEASLARLEASFAAAEERLPGLLATSADRALSPVTMLRR